MGIQDLIGKDLATFSIERYTEVYKMDEDGRSEESMGFFKDSTLASAYADLPPDPNWKDTREVLVLTNGEIGYLLGKEIQILDDEEAIVEVRRKALEKLSPAEQKLLGL